MKYSGSSSVHFGFGLIISVCLQAPISIVDMAYTYVFVLALIMVGYALNSICDAETDLLNSCSTKDVSFRSNPISNGGLKREKGIIILGLIAGFACLISIRSQFLFFVFVAFITLSFLYSSKPWRYKGRPLVDVTLISLGDLLLFCCGIQYAFSSEHIPAGLLVVISIMFFLFTFALTLPSIIDDMNSDRLVGLNTTAVYLGEQNSHKLVVILSLVNTLFGVVLLNFVEINAIIPILLFPIIMLFVLADYFLEFRKIGKLGLSDLNYGTVGLIGHTVVFISMGMVLFNGY